MLPKINLSYQIMCFLFIALFTGSSCRSEMSKKEMKTYFERIVISPMPKSVKDIKMEVSGGTATDFSCRFYFKISPDDLKKILKKGFELNDRKSSYRSFKSKKWATPNTSIFSERFIYIEKNPQKFHYLLTNKKHDTVYYAYITL
jgi:hypothetical protein